MLRIEALAIAICREHQVLEPSSEAFQTLNPGLLRPIRGVETPAKEVSPEGLRVFTGFQGGYRALVVNLQTKCAGTTNANSGKLAPTSTLAELCKTFRSINIRMVVEFLQDALNDSAINARTPIAFFIQDKS